MRKLDVDQGTSTLDKIQNTVLKKKKKKKKYRKDQSHTFRARLSAFPSFRCLYSYQNAIPNNLRNLSLFLSLSLPPAKRAYRHDPEKRTEPCMHRRSVNIRHVNAT